MDDQVFNYKSLQSTNMEAERILKVDKINQSFYVVADYQTGGRGQGENEWISETGKNLLFSWLVFPAFLSVSDQFQLSKAISLAIYDFLQSYIEDVKIKWPNDIFCKNRKIGGILIENSVMGDKLKHSIIGVGLNINQTIFPSFPYHASSMKLECGKFFQLEKVKTPLFKKLQQYFSELELGQIQKHNQQYLWALYGKDKVSTFADKSGEFQGLIRGVDDVGELLIETECGLRSFGFHEIKMKHHPC